MNFHMWPWKWLWVSIFLCPRLHAEHYGSTVKINPNPRGITITSFHLSSSMSSLWVDRIFGSSSIYYYRNTNATYLSNKALRPEEIERRHIAMADAVHLSEEELMPPCSIDLLGFVGLDTPESPFSLHQKYVGPIVGKSYLRMGHLDPWHCHYRLVFENWRTEKRQTAPNHWAVLMYCTPANNTNTNSTQSCSDLRNLIKKNRVSGFIPASLELNRGVHRMTNSFSIRVLNRDRMVKTMAKHAYTAAVCLAIPYTSSDPSKSSVNAALLAEWIRYYLKLNFFVIIYDRDGANRQAIYDPSVYKHSQGIAIGVDNSALSYHPFTIRGLLHPASKGMRYDNTEAIPENRSTAQYVLNRVRYSSQGHDKALTLTHCRFEAKAARGIDRVVVADFDEFLHCPVGGTSASEQRSFLSDFFAAKALQGVEQLMIPQRLLLNLTSSPRDCMSAKIEARESVFRCFAPYRFYMGGHSVKSVHFKLVCPMTGYHHSCSAEDAPRTYNCLCTLFRIYSNPSKPYLSRSKMECAFVHLSTNPLHYKPHKYPWAEDAIREARKETNTLQLISSG